MRKQDRDRLIRDHIPWATLIARERHQRWPVLDYDEMVGEAMIALVRAADRYDPTKGKFNSYVAARIHGAISDRARRDDPMGRDTRTQDAKLRKPRIRPRRMDADVADIEHGAWAARFPSLAPVQEEIVTARQTLERIRKIVQMMPPKYWTAWDLYFIKGHDFKAVGRKLGVTESRACQMISDARKLVKEVLARTG